MLFVPDIQAATGFVTPLLTFHVWRGVWQRKTLRTGLQNPSGEACHSKRDGVCTPRGTGFATPSQTFEVVVIFMP